jgi:hypothetical protein
MLAKVLWALGFHWNQRRETPRADAVDEKAFHQRRASRVLIDDLGLKHKSRWSNPAAFYF